MIKYVCTACMSRLKTQGAAGTSVAIYQSLPHPNHWAQQPLPGSIEQCGHRSKQIQFPGAIEKALTWCLSNNGILLLVLFTLVKRGAVKAVEAYNQYSTSYCAFLPFGQRAFCSIGHNLYKDTQKHVEHHEGGNDNEDLEESAHHKQLSILQRS